MGVFSSKSPKDNKTSGKSGSSAQDQSPQPEKPKTKRELDRNKIENDDKRDLIF